jgi:hypothetical protein
MNETDGVVLWGVQYAGPHGAGVVGPLKSRALAERRAEQLREAGAEVSVLPMRPWYETREAYGIDLSPKAKRLAKYRRDRVEKGPLMVPSVGTHRRLEALMAIGWSLPRLEQEAGLNRWTLSDIRKAKKVRLETAELVKGLYDRFSMTPPVARILGEKQSIERIKTIAQRNGWAPPMAWDDDLIDLPAAKPSLPEFWTYDERCSLVRDLLAEKRMTKKAIARAAHVAYKTVAKIEREAA